MSRLALPALLALALGAGACGRSSSGEAPATPAAPPLAPEPPPVVTTIPPVAPEPSGATSQWVPRPMRPAEQRSGLPGGVRSIQLPQVPGWRDITVVHGVTLDDKHVYFNDGYGRIWGALKDGSEAPFEVLAGQSESAPNPPDRIHAIDLIADGNEVIFTASSRGVMAVPKEGGAPRALTRQPSGPVVVVSDGVSVFYSSFDGSPIRRIPRDGGEATPFPVGIRSGSLAVDEAFLYITHYNQGTILRVPKGGGGVQTLTRNLPRPTGLALDATHVYFSCEGDGSVRRVPKAGGASQTLAIQQVNHDNIALDDEFVYWASWGTGTPLRRVRKDGSSPPQTLLAGLRSPSGITVDDQRVYVANKGYGEVLLVPKNGAEGEITYPPLRHYLTREPGAARSSTDTSDSASLGPVASSIPWETSPLPKSRGSRLATTITRRPTRSSGLNESARPATIRRGCASPTSTRRSRSLSLRGTRSAESTSPTRRSTSLNFS
jgi:sugar lactone lactonase YvrE